MAPDEPSGPGHTGMLPLLCAVWLPGLGLLEPDWTRRLGRVFWTCFRICSHRTRLSGDVGAPPASFPLTGTQNAPCSQAIWVSGMCLWTSAKMKMQVIEMMK